jgi:hypothetical protein
VRPAVFSSDSLYRDNSLYRAAGHLAPHDGLELGDDERIRYIERVRCIEQPAPDAA